MRKLLIILTAFLVLGNTISAQNKTFFILEDFTEARVYFKNNTVTVAPMNYDAGKNQMYFMQNDDVMELTNASAIDSIVWAGVGKFITNNNSFLEEIKLTNGVAYIEWKLKDMNVGSRGALGMTTQAKVDQVSLRSIGIYSTKDEKVVDVYQQKNDNTYYLPIDGKLHKIKSVKNLTKLLPQHKEQIEEYVKKRKIDTKNTLSFLQLFDYTLVLLK